jgi:adenylate kinase
MCKVISERYNLTHLSSGEILRWEEISNKQNKRVKDFVSTQVRLLNGLSEILEVNKNYILDGHFCLLNENGVPEIIPEETFYKINPISIAVKTSAIKDVIRRLKNRDKIEYDESILSKMQEMEINQARKISNILKIPFFIVDDQENQLFNKHLESYEGSN